jgi:hypothetical protein
MLKNNLLESYEDFIKLKESNEVLPSYDEQDESPRASIRQEDWQSKDTLQQIDESKDLTDKSILYAYGRLFFIDTKDRDKKIIELLEKGLADLKERPEYFEQFNSSNGWGMYEHFVPFVEKYLEACKEYPDAIIEVSREPCR